MRAAVDFTGSSGSIAFGTSNITEVFNQANDVITVFTPWEGGKVELANIQLGHARAYDPSMFSIQGDQLIFHEHIT
jgi:hypothetical protein